MTWNGRSSGNVRALDGHLPLLHRLEQRRLRLRRGAVDLVGQHAGRRTAGRAGTRTRRRAGPSTNEPVTSAGSRSGVNCTRRNGSPRVCASVRAASVLPRPGLSCEQHVAAGEHARRARARARRACRRWRVRPGRARRGTAPSPAAPSSLTAPPAARSTPPARAASARWSRGCCGQLPQGASQEVTGRVGVAGRVDAGSGGAAAARRVRSSHGRTRRLNRSTSRRPLVDRALDAPQAAGLAVGAVRARVSPTGAPAGG